MKNKKHDEEARQPGEPDVEALKAELEVLRREVAAKDDYHDKSLRMQAELDNARKRMAKERQDFIRFANEGLIIELLGILDDFERGVKAAEQKKDFGLLHQGVDIISRQLGRLLEDKGLKRIEALGKKFNPHEHEAIEVVKDDNLEDETVVEELQQGYILNDRIIRPAKVKVARRSSPDPGKEHIEEVADKEPQEEIKEDLTDEPNKDTEKKED